MQRSSPSAERGDWLAADPPLLSEIEAQHISIRHAPGDQPHVFVMGDGRGTFFI